MRAVSLYLFQIFWTSDWADLHFQMIGNFIDITNLSWFSNASRYAFPTELKLVKRFKNCVKFRKFYYRVLKIVWGGSNKSLSFVWKINSYFHEELFQYLKLQLEYSGLCLAPIRAVFLSFTDPCLSKIMCTCNMAVKLVVSITFLEPGLFVIVVIFCRVFL